MVKVLKAIDRGLDGFIAGTGLLAIVLMLLLSVFILLVALARHIVGINIPGFFDLAMYSLVVFPFATAAYTLREGKHISVDVFTERLPERTRAALNIAIYLSGSIFVIILGWYAWRWAYGLFSGGVTTTDVFALPKGVLVAFIVFGCLTLVLQMIRIVVKSIRSLGSCGVPGETSSPRLRDNPWLYVSIFIIGVTIGILLFAYGNPVAGLLVMLLLLLFSGMPVFLVMGLIGCIGIFLLLGSSSLIQTPITAYNAMESFPLTCLPLFIMGGLILQAGRVADDLFSFFAMLSRRFPASLLVATIFVGGIFCAITGSSAGATAVISAVAMPMLIRQGYSKALSSGTIGGTTIGGFIPPSIGFVVYCVLTEVSVAQMFMAAVIPGAIVFGMYFAYIVIRGIVSKKSLFEGGQIPSQAAERMSWKDRFLVTRRALWGLVLPIIILGGIYAGIFTPTEGAAVLVLYGVVVCVIITKNIKWRDLPRVTLRSATISSSILCIIFTAYIFTLVVSQLQISASILNWVETGGIGANGLLGLLFVMLLIGGLFIEPGPMKVITLPIFFPVAMTVGINPLFLGILYQIMGEIAFLTPPVGLNLFVIRGVTGVPLATVIRGVWPFVLIMMVALAICFLFPELVTWLPGTMSGR